VQGPGLNRQGCAKDLIDIASAIGKVTYTTSVIRLDIFDRVDAIRLVIVSDSCLDHIVDKVPVGVDSKGLAKVG
jgi:hypothetical protein